MGKTLCPYCRVTASRDKLTNHSKGEHHPSLLNIYPRSCTPRYSYKIAWMQSERGVCNVWVTCSAHTVLSYVWFRYIYTCLRSMVEHHP